jgi:hypothetical protein
MLALDASKYVSAPWGGGSLKHNVFYTVHSDIMGHLTLILNFQSDIFLTESSLVFHTEFIDSFDNYRSGWVDNNMLVVISRKIS